MRYPKLRELKEAVTALIKGPYTRRYPYEPHVPAPQFRGRPYFHDEDCVGCAACAQVCPTGAIEFIDYTDSDGIVRRRLTVHWDVCIFCGNCQAYCLTGKGIVLSNEYAFAVLQRREELIHRVEKKMVVCDHCREPVVPFDQYTWVARKLGPFCFSNASLILFYMRFLDLCAQAGKDERGGHKRADRIKVLCPRCRREAVLQS
jgi:formate hydrogenlyase subunit 6/NADH:ubiquinone oxidoreductase subunit I